jgi:hypothetical protein
MDARIGKLALKVDVLVDERFYCLKHDDSRL